MFDPLYTSNPYINGKIALDEVATVILKGKMLSVLE